MHNSILYKNITNDKVQCQTCSHYCTIKPGDKGICQVRQNIKGKLKVANYGRNTGLSVDPIEKKPLFRFMPGTNTLSFGAVGCNFKCLHCQNYWTSQADYFYSHNFVENKNSPEEIVETALENNCPSISYTYTEPTIFLEYALDSMKIAHKTKNKKGDNLKNVWVSNGFMSSQSLDLILPYLDAINVDLKSFSEQFYRHVCGARLKPVLNNLIKIKKAGVHLEVTSLIIPGKNDSETELKQMADFVAQKLGRDTPWHVTAFYPTYKLEDIPPTSKETIILARKIGQKAGLRFVYTGNI